MRVRGFLAALCLLGISIPLHAAGGALAIGGAPIAGRSAGAYRVTPDGELIRMWRDATSWQCRTIFTWGPTPAPESLISGGYGAVLGVNDGGALFNTYFEGPLARYAPLQHPFTLAPRSLALGGDVDTNEGVFGVTTDGRLARARWTGKPAWEFSIVPSWGAKIVPGSLISGDRRIYGVNEAGQLINTWHDDKGVLTFAVIEGRNDFVPGSLALGGTPAQHSSIYGVSKTNQLIRAWWNNGWQFQTAAVDGGLTPSLISGNDSVYGVDGKGRIVQASVANGAIRIATIGNATGIVPGSIAIAGAPAANNDIYGVDAQGRLVRTFNSGPELSFRGIRVGGGGWTSAIVNGVTVAAKSLVSTEGGVYGIDTNGRPFAVTLVNNTPTVTYPCPAPSPGVERRRAHAKVLREAFGITDVGSLGRLTLNGSVVPSEGLLRPRADLISSTTAIKAARRGNTATRQFAPLAVTASVLKSEPFPSFKTAAMDIPLDAAYIAAKTIQFADDTNVILKFPNRHLVLIAEELIVGNNVTITYERQDATPPAKPGKPAKPGTPAVPDPFSTGRRGADGSSGTSGSAGWSFVNSPAPEVEVWVLSMTGSPAFDLRGQDGGAGGAGGDGADGGNGSAGSPSDTGKVLCDFGPGSGGDGGNGGRAGDGGKGGDGAPGGRLTFFAPANIVAQYASGFFITVDGGSAGPGGIPGTPGSGGAGGAVGEVRGNACKKPAASRVSGNSGAQGGAGVQGGSGNAGLPQTPNPVQMLAIQASDFILAWESPAIAKIDVPGSQNGRAFEGDVITVHGQYFLNGDTILVEKAPNQWLPAVTQYMGDKLLTFVVPQVPGGLRSIVLEQTGTARQSNKLSLYVLPKLMGTNPQPRIRPGDTVLVNGKGFAQNMRVFLNDQECGALTYVDEHTLKYLVVRPKAGIAPNPAGEPASLVLRLADGTATAPLGVILDTYQIEVLGDSIAWDVGLQESVKYSGLVEQKVRDLNQSSNIGVYRRTPAHTGAILGVASRLPQQAGLPAIPGEVPTESPTVKEMLDGYAADPASANVDLVLLTACINDIKIFTMLDPQVSIASLDAKVTASCHDDMLTTLKRAAAIFPSAKIVITSYFAPLSPMSDGAGLVAFLVAIDHPLVKIPGEIVNGVLKPGTRMRVIQNSMFFAQKSTQELLRAVNDANGALGGAPRVFFADAKFGPQNAALAGPDAWLYGVNLDLSPQDVLAPTRKGLCEQHNARTDKPLCIRASAGHPNVTGAQQYANAIFPFL